LQPREGVTLEMVESSLLDRKRVLPCAVLLQGEFGVDGLFVGVPIVLGAAGMERIFEIELTDDERGAFERSAAGARAPTTGPRSSVQRQPSRSLSTRCPDEVRLLGRRAVPSRRV